MRSIFLLVIIVAFSSSCKKKKYKEAEIMFNLCAEVGTIPDSSLSNFYDMLSREITKGNRMVKIDNEYQWDSIKGISAGQVIQPDFDSKFLYVFLNDGNAQSCYDYICQKIKINTSEKQIEFYTKIRRNNGESSRRIFAFGFLKISKSEESFRVKGTLDIKSEFFGLFTGVTYTPREYSYYPN